MKLKIRRIENARLTQLPCEIFTCS